MSKCAVFITGEHNWWPVDLQATTSYTVVDGVKHYANEYFVVEVCTACHRHRNVPSERET
jgi:hypothetical protein